MLDNVSADGLRRGPRVRSIHFPAAFSPGQKLLLLGLNALPLVHVAATAASFWLLPIPLVWRWITAIAVFFVLPPLITRLVLAKPLTWGRTPVPSGSFFRWWATWQLQGVFNRVPWIEEGLRMVPGLYSLWLRLWGARVGRLTLWSPGARVYDRPLLRIGHDVVIGIETRLCGHFGNLDEDGKPCLTLGLITVEDRCTVGGSAFLGPGLHLEPDQATEVLFLGTPFARWRGGLRIHSSESTNRSASSL